MASTACQTGTSFFCLWWCAHCYILWPRSDGSEHTAALADCCLHCLSDTDFWGYLEMAQTWWTRLLSHVMAQWEDRVQGAIAQKNQTKTKHSLDWCEDHASKRASVYSKLCFLMMAQGSSSTRNVSQMSGQPVTLERCHCSTTSSSRVTVCVCLLP